MTPNCAREKYSDSWLLWIRQSRVYRRCGGFFLLLVPAVAIVVDRRVVTRLILGGYHTNICRVDDTRKSGGTGRSSTSSMMWVIWIVVAIKVSEQVHWLSQWMLLRLRILLVSTHWKHRMLHLMQVKRGGDVRVVVPVLLSGSLLCCRGGRSSIHHNNNKLLLLVHVHCRMDYMVPCCGSG